MSMRCGLFYAIYLLDHERRYDVDSDVRESGKMQEARREEESLNDSGTF